MLTNRGFRIEEIEHYLNTTDDDILDPAQLANIKDGVTMLIKNINACAKTVIIVD